MPAPLKALSNRLALKVRSFADCPEIGARDIWSRTVSFYKRRLPHWLPENRAIFLTWRLYGSVPAGRFGSSELSDGEKFKQTEKILDRCLHGPVWLNDPRVAQLVLEAIIRGSRELRHYDLHSYSIMPNHVHLLVVPKLQVRKFTRALKGVTARKANQLLHRTGLPFWQDESFDHWIRDDGEFWRLKHYIERNPVKAGLVRSPQEWPWSSASKSV